jgi:hypothetical protein
MEQIAPVIDANPSYRDWVLASALDAAEHEQNDPSQHQ